MAEFNPVDSLAAASAGLKAMVESLPVTVDYSAIAKRVSNIDGNLVNEMDKLRLMIEDQPMTEMAQVAAIDLTYAYQTLVTICEHYLDLQAERAEGGDDKSIPGMMISCVQSARWLHLSITGCLEAIGEELRS
ncbi:hypothetical protein [Salininema proteolyticum]|uniref:Uncharacterized protein n=1 Tax=Salininema proteolyticum TaxID=1607685 RepID=A0ABV8TXJ8_9ACTN